MHAQQIGSGTVVPEASATVETSPCDIRDTEPAPASAPALVVDSTAASTEPAGGRETQKGQ